MGRKIIWIVNDDMFSKFDEFYQQTDPTSSMKPKKEECKENNTKAFNNQTAENKYQREYFKAITGKNKNKTHTQRRTKNVYKHPVRK